MNKIFLSALLLSAAAAASAQTTISIERKDGTKFHTSLENFREVTFTDETETAFEADNNPVYSGITIQYFDKNAYGAMVSMENIAPHLWMASIRLEGSGQNDCMTCLMDDKQETFWAPESTEGDVTTFKKNPWIEYSYYSTGTYLFVFNDATCKMQCKRMYDEADVTEKIVEVETLPKSDYTVAVHVAGNATDAEYLGSGLWRAKITISNGEKFSVTRTNKESEATAWWGASEENETAAWSGKITEGSDLEFTFGLEDGRYTVLFDEENCTYAFMTANAVSLRTLTFEDRDYRGSGNAFSTPDAWSGLIDNPQYGGAMLYGAKASDYRWYDEGNTGLRWDGFVSTGYMANYSAGGYAVSNYVSEPSSSPACQLSIPFGDGSNNFCVAFNREDSYTSKKINPIYFADGKARVIRSIKVTNNSYAAGSLLYGDAFASAAKEGTEFFVNIRGTKEDGTTAVVKYHLCKDTNVLTDSWATVDCTPLGAVKSIEIFVTGSDDLGGAYGLNTPGYVAFDDIVVEY